VFSLQDQIAIVTGAGSGICAALAESCAAAAVFLAGDEAAFVTGSALVVDGGYLAGK
jgi:NAD(P)-dependent dehydrogenase (short-subunit alcohol dehydrogenase family)